MGAGVQIARKGRWSAQIEGTAGFIRRPFVQGAAYAVQTGLSQKLRCELGGNTYFDMGITKHLEYDFWLGELDIPNGYSFGIGKRF